MNPCSQDMLQASGSKWCSTLVVILNKLQCHPMFINSMLALPGQANSNQGRTLSYNFSHTMSQAP